MPNQEKKTYVSLDALLRNIEFPGEDPEAIKAYLRKHGVVDSVMQEIYALTERTQRTGWWLLFALVNMLILIFIGTDAYKIFTTIAFHAVLSQFFFLFLGITLLGSLIGIILSLDSKKVDAFVGRLLEHF